ncbi:hypothetical protein [Brachybacterium phenoliresistens]|uniref:hypothetical protein n=1 Tax=Brachybacterium phenoliresistens TaxID=396014 RepID=UPI0031D617C6
MPTTARPADPAAGTHDGPAHDAATLLGFAVASLALGGVCWMLGAHLLIGALRLAAGMLMGLGAGLTVLAILARLRPGRRGSGRGPAAALGLALALALTVPAAIAHRPDSLADAAIARLAPLAEGDGIIAGRDPDAPVLIHRATGPDELLDPADGSLRTLPEADGDRVLLAADGTRVLLAGAGSTRVLDATAPGAAPPLLAEVAGTPIALAGDLLVVQEPTQTGCATRGHDLATGEEAAAALWTLVDATEGGCEATRALVGDDAPAAVLPTVPVRTDPRQGILQMDPATGFPVGQVLARAQEHCRAHVTGPEPAPPGSRPGTEDLVLLVCSGEDGALSVRAFAGGAPLWASAPSPAGQWEVRADAGRVIATGTEQGTDVPGEIVASRERAAWSAPGGPVITAAGDFRARLGIDGTAMVVVNSGAQTVAYDTANGRQLWALPASGPDAEVTGSSAHGTSIVLDPAVRSDALDPRDAQRLRVVDADGTVTAELVLRERPGSLHPLPGGRALVGTGDALLLIASRI